MSELNKIALKFVGKSKFKETYKNPIPEKVKLMERFFDLLHKETSTGNLNLNSNTFRELCKEFKIRKRKITDEILFFEGPPLETPIAFFWRIGKVKVPGNPDTYSNPVDPLILEAPHEGKDNTSRTATKIFESTNAKILLLNAVHPKIGRQNVRCRKSAYNSDGAHCELTLFHRIHVKLYEMFPYSFFVQIHGWANTKFLMMCMNGHNNLFTRNRKSGPLLFARAGITSYKERARKMIFMGDKGVQTHGYKRPGGFHNTCVQARHLNGGNQCKIGDSDKGKFMHIEFGQKMIKKSRHYNHNIKKFCETLNLTMEDWVSLEDEFKKVSETTEINEELVDTENENKTLDEELLEFYETDCSGSDCETIIESENEIESIAQSGIEIEDPDEIIIENSDTNKSIFNCLKKCLPKK